MPFFIDDIPLLPQAKKVMDCIGDETYTTQQLFFYTSLHFDPGQLLPPSCPLETPVT